MNQLSCYVPTLSNIHSNYLPMIFALWFLSCQYCSWNPLFNVFSPCSLFLLSFRWVSVNNMWIIPVSCELLLSPSALPFSLHIFVWFCHQVWKDCPLFIVIHCDFDQREKAVCPERRASCSGVPWRVLLGSSGCCWLGPYGDKSQCLGWLRALVFVRCYSCSLSRVDLMSVDSVSFQGTEWLLYLGNLYLSVLGLLVIQWCALQLLVFTAECGLITDYCWLEMESNH